MAYRQAPSEELREVELELYEKLRDEHGYVAPPYFKVPGQVIGVKKTGVEVSTVSGVHSPQTQKAAIRIDVNLPIDMNPPIVEGSVDISLLELPPSFNEVSCAGITFLQGKENLFIATRNDIALVVPRILALTKEGSRILKQYPDRVIKEFWEEAGKNELLR